jgi:hypothetical protein
VNENGLDVLKRILYYFDVDIFSEMRRYQECYTVRLWDEGEQVAEASGEDLESVLLEIDKTAEALVSYC